jgi:hypothetical protein
VILHTAARVLTEYLYTTGLVSRPTSGAAWPMYWSSMPNNPANALACYDTQGILDGRIMQTGHIPSHPGIQIRVRATSDPVGVQKLFGIMNALDLVHDNTVVVPAEPGIMTKTYKLQSIQRTTDILSLGVEEGSTFRLFTTNALVTYGEN